MRATSSCHRCRSRLVGGAVRSSQDACLRLPHPQAVFQRHPPRGLIQEARFIIATASDSLHVCGGPRSSCAFGHCHDCGDRAWHIRGKLRRKLPRIKSRTSFRGVLRLLGHAASAAQSLPLVTRRRSNLPRAPSDRHRSLVCSALFPNSEVGMTEREATLDELLSEPIIRKVMASDGVRAADVRRLLRQASVQTYRQSNSVAKATVDQFSARPSPQSSGARAN